MQRQSLHYLSFFIFFCDTKTYFKNNHRSCPMKNASLKILDCAEESVLGSLFHLFSSSMFFLKMLNVKLCSQRCIQNQAKNLRWSFFAKIVDGLQPLTISAQTLLRTQMFDWDLNTPLVHGRTMRNGATKQFYFATSMS